MDGLFPPTASIDLGPSTVFPPDWAPRRTSIQGQRPSQLRAQLRLLGPGLPGVYAMIDRDQKIIYVGKAKDLRKRMLSYFRSRSRVPKARRIVTQARVIVWEVLPTEFTALLRELELIRRWRPAFNVQGQPLRRRHAYLFLAGSPAPHLFLSRRPPRTLVAAFGPVPVTHGARQAVRWLNDLFRLRDCPPGPVALFPSPSQLLPLAPPAGCLRLDLGTCLGPCTDAASPAGYRQQVLAARRFLDGLDLSILTELGERMSQAAQAQRFEAAARCRDQREHLTWLSERLAVLRHSQQRLSFVYPMAVENGGTWWYLLHGARVLGCVAAPRTPAEASTAREHLARIYATPTPLVLDAYEPVDGMMLVVSWFRKYPRQTGLAIAPADALKQVDGS